MNDQTAKILCKLNNDFYRSQSASFSATRQSPWTGWGECTRLLREANFAAGASVAVFDLACGNLRFEAFLAEEFPDTDLSFYAVDNCDDLVASNQTVHYQNLDVLGVLNKARSLTASFEAPTCDLSVSFGFMHHIPQPQDRLAVLQALIEQTAQGGHVIVSFWQFMNNEALAKKAHATHQQALVELDLPPLSGGDYLLGWKDVPGRYRYCHSFSEPEIDDLAQAVANEATPVARFKADGRTSDLNTYLVLKITS